MRQVSGGELPVMWIAIRAVVLIAVVGAALFFMRKGKIRRNLHKEKIVFYIFLINNMHTILYAYKTIEN